MPLPANLVDAYPTTGADLPVLKVTQGTPQDVQAVLRDLDGTVWEIPADHTVRLVAAETRGAGAATIIVDGSVVTAAEGIVKFSFTAAKLTVPGIWLGEIIVSNTSAVPVKNFACYLEITPTLATAQTWAPVTIAEVRMAMRDRVPGDNFLLDAVEFSDAEIMACLRKPVDWWNSTVPAGLPTYTYTTFPYRYQWLNGTVGELLRLISYNLKRNQLAMQGQGVNIDDKAKGDFYVQRGEQLIGEWQQWAFNKIRQINIDGWFGREANPHFGR